MTALRGGAGRRDVRPSELGPKILWPLWASLAALMATAARDFANQHAVGMDAHAYWLAGRHSQLYGRPPMSHDAFLYSPAFKQLIWPLAQLPWPAFCAVWMVATSVTFIWLLKPLGWGWGVPAFLCCGFAIIQGNITAFLAACLVLGMRRPAVWAVALLTKVVVGIGPLWFAVRREWRALAESLVVTAAVAGLSALVDPGAWSAWLHFLVHNRGTDATLIYRFAAGVLLVGYAARRNRAWLLAPAMVLVSPVLHGIAVYLTMLAAIPRLRAPRRDAPPAAAPTDLLAAAGGHGRMAR
jgi:hypothetical protein